MFAAIKRRWQEARGNILLEEVDEVMMAKLPAFPPAMLQEFIRGYVEASALVDKRYGALINISHRLKKEIADELRKAARMTFDRNIGRATGGFMVSAKIEALSLPGDSALMVLGQIAVVEEMIGEMIAEMQGEEDQS